MKILSNKKYRELMNYMTKLNDKNTNLEQELDKSNWSCAVFKSKIELLKANNTALENEIKSLKSAKGGYVKQINKLKTELEETQKKLEESMTDKYLVKKVPMGKLPKGQVMKMKSHAKQDKIIKKVYERMEKEEI